VHDKIVIEEPERWKSNKFVCDFPAKIWFRNWIHSC